MGLLASKKQISRLVSTYGRFQGNLFEIVETVKITIKYDVKYVFQNGDFSA